jgi:hypothetical protein
VASLSVQMRDMELARTPEDFWQDDVWGNDNYNLLWCHIFQVRMMVFNIERARNPTTKKVEERLQGRGMGPPSTLGGQFDYPLIALNDGSHYTPLTSWEFARERHAYVNYKWKGLFQTISYPPMFV